MKNSFSKLFVLIILSIVFPSVSFAQAAINEIMYDVSGTDSGREWVEIYNSGSGNVDMSTLKFLESNTASNHGLTLISGQSGLSAGGFAIISNDPDKFLADWPSFSGNLFKASFSSLNNTNGTVLLKDADGNVLDQVSYASSMGANGDGNSLQKNSSGWVAASATPGAANTTSNTPNSSNNNSGEVLSANTANQSGDSNLSATSGVAQPTYSTLSTQLEVSAGSDRLTSPGSPISLQAQIKKNSSANSGVTFAWSFGDGNVGDGGLVTHTYRYPGEYAVVLNAKAGNIFATARLKVKVIQPQITVSDGGEYLEIVNNGNAEINLFNWKIEHQGKGFIFQPDTIILPHSSIKIEKSLLKMKGLDNSLGTSLKNSLKEEIFAVAQPAMTVILADTPPNVKASANAAALTASQSLLQKTIAKKPEVLPVISKATSTQPASTVIYEAPKKEGIFLRLTKFIKRVFYK